MTPYLTSTKASTTLFIHHFPYLFCHFSDYFVLLLCTTDLRSDQDKLSQDMTLIMDLVQSGKYAPVYGKKSYRSHGDYRLQISLEFSPQLSYVLALTQSVGIRLKDTLRRNKCR